MLWCVFCPSVLTVWNAVLALWNRLFILEWLWLNCSWISWWALQYFFRHMPWNCSTHAHNDNMWCHLIDSVLDLYLSHTTHKEANKQNTWTTQNIKQIKIQSCIKQSTHLHFSIHQSIELFLFMHQYPNNNICYSNIALLIEQDTKPFLGNICSYTSKCVLW